MRSLRSNLDDETYAALHAFAAAAGVSVSGLIEAIGRTLADDRRLWENGDLAAFNRRYPVLKAAISAARRIDADRRSRS